MFRVHHRHVWFVADVCQVNNGGCDVNAICSRDPTTNVAKCTCKSGYINTGSTSNVVCTGIRDELSTEMNNDPTLDSSRIVVVCCNINNGGCDVNAFCSQNRTSNTLTCTCKLGFTNVGSATNVTCKGERVSRASEEINLCALLCCFLFLRQLSSEKRRMSRQFGLFPCVCNQ